MYKIFIFHSLNVIIKLSHLGASMNIQNAILNATTRLDDTSSPRLDAEILLSYVLKKNRTYLYAHQDQHLSEVETDFYQHLINERTKFIPIAYLIGSKEFWSIPLKISTSTLIPRPATESLIDYILKNFKQTNMNVCDLGTGTGAIAIALANERPHWQITGLDIKAGSIALAKWNAKILKRPHIRFLCSNWFAKIPQQQFDLIVANPPYIAENDPHLKLADVQHEPLSALVSKADGYQDLKYLIDESQKHLFSNGQLILEHGYKQQNILLDYFESQNWSKFQGFCDDEGQPRFCVASR